MTAFLSIPDHAPSRRPGRWWVSVILPLSITAVAIWGYFALDRILSSDVEGSLGRALALRVQTMERHYRHNRQIAETWARNPIVLQMIRGTGGPIQQSAMDTFRRQLQINGYVGFLVVDGQRRICRSSGNAAYVGKSLSSSNDSYDRAIIGQAGFSSIYRETDYRLPDPDGEPAFGVSTMTYAVPVREGNGGIEGVLLLRTDPSRWFREVAELGLERDEDLLLVDAAGRLLNAPRSAPELRALG